MKSATHPTRREALMLLGGTVLGCGSNDQASLKDLAAGGGPGSGVAGGGAGMAGASGSGGSQVQGGAGGSDGPGGEGGGAGSGNGAGNGGSAGGVGEAGAGGTGGAPQCVLRPEQTLGPFPNRSDLNRSDVRAGEAGAPLRLALVVYRAGACTPVENATVELWQCNAAGDYSEYSDFGTADQNWLRGYQVTGADGSVEFVTIYPGWYPGRAVHIHIRVRAEGQTFVSQLYFDDALSDQVLQNPPYTEHVGTRTRNTGDGIFQGGGAELMLDVLEQAGEYVATFDVALAIA